MSGKRELKACANCGGEYIGGKKSTLCPDCRRRRQSDGYWEQKESTVDKGDGWRNMYRDETGTVIRAGGNVMDCLDDLCAYEEACEAAGIQGPDELGQLLRFLAPDSGSLRKMVESAKKWEREQKEKAAQLKRDDPSSGPSGHLPPGGKALERNADGEIVYSCRFCGSCGHFQQDSGTGRGTAGHCDAHPRMTRSGGGKKGKLAEVPGEFRKVAGAREACRKWTARETAPNAGRDATSSGPSGHLPLKGKALDERAGQAPQWIGPSAELLPEEASSVKRRPAHAADGEQCSPIRGGSDKNVG